MSDGLFARLKSGLAKSAGGLTGFFTKKKLDAATIAELEEMLIKSDMGSAQAHAIAQAVARNRYDAEIEPGVLRSLLAAEIERILKPLEKPLLPDPAKKPFVILVAGVNGTGKTTTIGKLASRLGKSGHKVMLAAGDTFRAAAIEQLSIWAKRAGAEFAATKPGGDAAGLAFEALEKARASGADTLIIDTAGRLQNKSDLMAELEKIARVIKKLDPSAPHAVLLVLDATTGQNAISQVEAFGTSVPLTGLVMTKLDGTAKGGILVALAARFALPVHFVGVGEGEDDLMVFNAENFAKALTGCGMNPQFRRLLLDLGPLIVFFAAFKYLGIFGATAAFMACVLAALCASYILEKRLSPMPVFTAILVLIFGGLTLYLKNDIFIKMKPTVLYAFFGATLIGGLAFKRLFIKYVFAQAFDLDETGWRQLTWRWGIFFLSLAVLNEAVWRNASTDTWVSFKVWGIIPLIFLFALAQTPFVVKHHIEPEKTAD